MRDQMDKMLMVASVASMIDQFNMSNINILLSLGYEVHVAANFESGNTTSKSRLDKFKEELNKLNIHFFQVDFSRNVIDLNSNVKAYKQIKKLIEINKYKFIHCHSPIGGVISRIAAKRAHIPIVYTAHGFHFYKGGSIKNWMFYPIERLLAHYTDVLITINNEDYSLAKRFQANKVIYIPGVGLDTKVFRNVVVDKAALRSSLGIPKDAIVLFSVGELCKRKNHETVIKALQEVGDNRIYYIICGKGELLQHLEKLCENIGLRERVIFLGYRTDIKELCKASDIYVFPSVREGLGIAALEGMSAGLPLISSNVNGIKDYTENEKTGYCVNPYDINGFSEAIKHLADNIEQRKKIGYYNQEVVKKFDLENVNKIMLNVYKMYK